ncbi:efflux RND transporter periplasmic adaptor subunit [Pararobbsia alpina]|uniref:efflux RND transporter periplasmic adaptor subunit n=1 Tax=Pararobbsia alpina TaxID=621374 RepID=UPI001FE707DF|nr:efflux RND transporter periplasmic adaptor subunit [Pararobbsia alpina]
MSLAVLLVALLCASVVSPTARADDTPEVRTSVRTVPARQGIITQPVRAYGIVAADGASVTTLSVPYAAHLVRWRVARGQAVTRGAPLFDVMADPAAVLAAQQARSALDVAQRELARTRALYDGHLATASQLDAASKALEDARQADVAQRLLGLRPGSITVNAPFNGVVLQMSAAQGDALQPGAAVMQLSRGGTQAGNTGNLELSVEPSDVRSLHVGDAVTVRTLAAQSDARPTEGHIVNVGAAIDSQTQQVTVMATLATTGTDLLPGSHVVADILPSGTLHWIVPRSSVLNDENGAFLFQVDPHRKAHRVAVVVRVERDASYGIDGPLTASWPVISTGNYELQDGGSVKPEAVR